MGRFWFKFQCPDEDDVFFINTKIFDRTGDIDDCFKTREDFDAAVKAGEVKFRNGICYILFTEVSE